MSAESKVSDPYETVLADLRAKRDQIDQTILAIESFRSGAATGTVKASATAAGAGSSSAAEGPGAFLGMTIVDATKVLLEARRQPLKNPEIAAALKAGGLHLNSADPVNTIGAVITRRFNDVGDIVKLGRGTWGLKEWYPNRSFKKGGKDDADSDTTKDD